MTWHLKNRDVEKWLIELCPDLLERIKEGIDDKRPDDPCISLSFNRTRRDKCKHIYISTLWIWLDELEEVSDYNPNAWNDYPKVTPPEGVPMSVESVYGQYAYRECAIFDHGIWKTERDGKPTEFLLIGQVKRFRPWGY